MIITIRAFNKKKTRINKSRYIIKIKLKRKKIPMNTIKVLIPRCNIQMDINIKTKYKKTHTIPKKA